MGRSSLTKKRCVLWRHHQLDVPNGVAFSNDEDEAAHVTNLFLHPDVWGDMGEPDEVTVTIRPGDHLNG